MPQVILMLADDPMDALLHGADEPVLSEPGEIDGHDCYRVKISRDLMGTTTFWIDQETFLLRRVVLPTDELRRAVEPPSNRSTACRWWPISPAPFDAAVNPKAFEFEVPQGCGDGGVSASAAHRANC